MPKVRICKKVLNCMFGIFEGDFLNLFLWGACPGKSSTLPKLLGQRILCRGDFKEIPPAPPNLFDERLFGWLGYSVAK